MRYSLELSGPGGAHETHTVAPGVTSVTLSLNPGHWTIHAEALSPSNIPCGTGQADVTLEQGKTTPAHITMTRNTWFVASSFSTPPGSDTGADTDGSETTPFATMDRALDRIAVAYSNLAWPGKSTASPAKPPMAARIVVDGAIDTGDGDSDNRVRVIGDAAGSIYTKYPPIILTGKTAEPDDNSIAGDAGRRVLFISKADVTLGPGLTLKDGETDGNGGGVYVISGGIFTLDGGIIANNKTTDAEYGGGVYVGPSSSFTMKSGNIKSNASDDDGGGVYFSGTTFTMTGGTIETNSATNRGGGVFVFSGDFNMSGGTISDNTAPDNGGGVAFTSNGTFTMSGGTIGGTTAEKNSAVSGGGVFVGAGNFKMSGGTISGNLASSDSAGSGGGVLVTSTGSFEMSGGTISGNTASNKGGGVYFSGATFAMTGGTIADNQTSIGGSTGGGVHVNSGTFEMEGTAKISGNKSGNGGGVYVNSGSFSKSGTDNSIIYGDNDNTYGNGNSEDNTATSGQGHAVYVLSGTKKRNSTAGEEVYLNSDESGAWEP
jgi:hypothetical protein